MRKRLLTVLFLSLTQALTNNLTFEFGTDEGRFMLLVRAVFVFIFKERSHRYAEN